MDNTLRTLLQLVKELNIKISSKVIYERLLQHPNYPTLLSVCDVLSEYNIRNAAYNISINDLQEAPSPCIAHIRDEKFILIKQIKDGIVYYLNSSSKETSISIQEFSKDFTGNILVAWASSDAGDPQYLKTRVKELFDSVSTPLIVTAILIIFSFLIAKYSSFLIGIQLETILIAVFTSLGLVVSILLLIQSIDSSNPLIHKLCFGERTSCNSILSSKASKILGGTVSLSEIGFYYFAGSLLLLLFNTHSIGALQTLATINLLSLPFTFYSIYYQGVIVKQWCTLCCTIQALLWLEFTQLGHYLLLPININNSSNFTSLLIAFILPALIWLLIKPYLTKLQSLNQIKEDLNEFKRNEDLFQTLLKNQTKYALLNEQNSLKTGDDDSVNVVTIVSNPYCGPCGNAHKLLDDWLLQGVVKFKLQSVFVTINEEGERVAKHLAALINEKEKLTAAINDWYSRKNKDFDSWASLYPANITRESEIIYKKQVEWCKLIDVEYTPTILINGYKLPKPYQLEDIKYFI